MFTSQVFREHVSQAGRCSKHKGKIPFLVLYPKEKKRMFNSLCQEGREGEGRDKRRVEESEGFVGWGCNLPGGARRAKACANT